MNNLTCPYCTFKNTGFGEMVQRKCHGEKEDITDLSFACTTCNNYWVIPMHRTVEQIVDRLLNEKV